uniref:Splicing factor 3A subunit 1 n=1 Tax=Aceria tosichella TaxID=561515 RepID=A0A6G1SEP6_9ACAR
MSEPVGIIHPPPELRGIVDSTAKYVAKNGGAFEERIMREHKGKPKFSFLFPNDPFNAYYKHKVREIRNAILNEEQSKRPDEGHDSTDASNKTESRTEDSHNNDNNNHSNHDDTKQKDEGEQFESIKRDNNTGYDQRRSDPGEQIDGHEGQDDQVREQSDDGDDDGQNDENNLSDRDETGPRVKPKLGEYMQEISMKLEEPPHLNFLANPASFITHFESDIIKLTSKFIATYGRQFLLELVSREQGNHHFDFLKPQHGQFPYMTKLIMQYALIQNPPLDILEELKKDSTSQKHVLDRIKMRAEWNKMLEAERLKREEAAEKEKNLYSQIDWHDFVVVETIDYQYNEVGEYPPTTPDQVGTRLLQQQRKEDHTAPEEMEIDMDVESDDQDDESDNTSDQETAKTEGGFVAPNPPDLSNVVIRRDYDPKVAPKATPQPDNYFVSPITNERIPVDKIHEHVRYNLADPRYLEKKEQMLQDKIKEDAVFASGSQIQDSLKNLAERRTDIFGMNEAEAEIGRRIGEEEQEESKDNKLIWDGHKSSIKKKRLN